MFTHIVHFTKSTRFAGSVPSSFRTTADAVKLSIEGLKRNSSVSDIRVEEL